MSDYEYLALNGTSLLIYPPTLKEHKRGGYKIVWARGWEECPEMLFSPHGMFIALMSSYAEVTFIRLVKIKSGKIRLRSSWGFTSDRLLSVDSYWMRGNHLYCCVITGKLPILHWMDPYTCTMDSTNLGFLGYLKREMTWVWCKNMSGQVVLNLPNAANT